MNDERLRKQEEQQEALRLSEIRNGIVGVMPRLATVRWSEMSEGKKYL